MTHFIRSGSRYNVTPNANVDIEPLLPVGSYTVQFDDMAGVYYLEQTSGFTVSGKIYGDTQKRADRIMQTFLHRPNSTGVMLSGEKGSGKTLLAKKLSVDGAKQGIPTIIINQAWFGDKFNAFMQMIDQPTIVIFDEFEKVYDRDQQEKMLTLLDGVYPSKKLFIITCNDKYRVDAHMSNRPGRVFYHLNYAGLERAFIQEYCDDNLDNKAHIEGVCRAALLFSSFNFDILKAMVEEMNRYGETAHEAMEMLNAKPETGEAVTYLVQLFSEGALMEDADTEWRGNVFGSRIGIDYKKSNKTRERGRRLANPNPVVIPWDEPEADGGSLWRNAQFTAADLKSIDTVSGAFIFENDQNEKLVLSRKPAVTVNYNYDAV